LTIAKLLTKLMAQEEDVFDDTTIKTKNNRE
jgi:hypothetical protein